MRRILAALVALVISTVFGVVPTVEARTNLNGDYAFTTNRSCTTTNGPDFATDPSGAPTIIVDGGFFRQIATESGTTTYNPDGTGVSTGRSVTMNISAGAGASILSLSEFSVPFTYTIENNDQLVTALGTSTFVTILGAGTGNTGTVSPGTRHAQIGNGGNTIVTGPAVDFQHDTLTFTGGPSAGLVQHRLCTRSTTSVKK